MADPTDKDGNVLPKGKRTVHAHSWRWAREGRSSCAIHETRLDDRIFLFGALRQPGERPPQPGSSEEDSTKLILQEMLAGLITRYERQGWMLDTMGDTAATLKRRTPHVRERLARLRQSAR